MDKKKLHIAIIILGIIFLSLGAFHTNIWYDEAYTVSMCTHTFKDIWVIGAKDVHPVLYYFMLKIINLIFGTNILIYRLFSLVPMAILGILGYTHIRKDFGEKTGLLFSFFILFMPGITRYAMEIRMYSWAMLFVTLTAIYGYRLYRNEFSIKNLCIFGIFSLASAYTHYYGLMASGIINVIIFIYLLTKLRNRKKEFLEFTLCAVLQVALYIPWLMIFISQVTSISENGFWITISFPNTLFEVLTVQMATGNVMKMILLIPTILIYIYIGYLIYKAKKEKEDIKPGIIAFSIYVLVAFSAFIISIVMRPILMDRYLLVVIGLLMFAMAFFISKAKRKVIPAIICILILCLSIGNNISIIATNYSKKNTEMIEYINNNLEENDSFILYNNAISGFAITAKHLDHKQYFHDKGNWGIGGAYDCFLPNCIRTDSIDEIMENASGRIWIINISEEEFENDIQSKYDVKLIERKEFQTKYNGYFFSFTLIEK